MLSAGKMTEQVQIYRKGIAGTSPEQWIREGKPRRASIWRISDRAALEESAQYTFNATHHASVDSASGFEPVGAGARLLVRLSDGQNFWVWRVVEAGPRKRRGGSRYMRLSLSSFEPALK